VLVGFACSKVYRLVWCGGEGVWGCGVGAETACGSLVLCIFFLFFFRPLLHASLLFGLR
jgi:hypothetical protein